MEDNSKIEKSLSEISDNTSHISESVNSGLTKMIVDYLSAITENTNGFSGAFTTSTQVTNPQTQTFQNSTGDSFKDILDEIRDFKNAVISQMGQSNVPFEASLEDMKSYFDRYMTAQKQAKDDLDKKNRKTAEEKAKIRFEQERDNKKEENEYKRLKKEDESWGEKGARGVGFAASIATSIAKGIKFDDAVGGAINAVSKFGKVGFAVGGIMSGLKALFDLYAAQDKAASQYAREIGGGRTGKIEMLQRQSQFIREEAKWGNGYTPEEMMKSIQGLSEQIGRSTAGLSNNSIAKSIDLNRMGVGAEAVNLFDSFGKSLNQTDKYFTELYQSVSKKGLSFKNVSKAVNDNLKQAQQYSFSNGLKSLERMAEKSTQLKFGMQQAFTFAEKMSTFEGAIETSANLSALGGDFARFANPMQLMYEGLNDVDALQDRIIKMFGNKAQFDRETGQMRISALDQQMIKQAAQSMGLDSGEMMSLALNQGKFNRIESQIGYGIEDETKEYIKNLAQLDAQGNAYISMNGQDKLVSELTDQDKEALKDLSEAKASRDAAGLGDIYQETMGIGERLDNILKYLTTRLGAWVAKLAGVKWDGNAGKAYWNSLNDAEQQELIAKYGSRAKAKRAIGALHLEDNAVNNYFGGESKRKIYDDLSVSRKLWNKKVGNEGEYSEDYSNKTWKEYNEELFNEIVNSKGININNLSDKYHVRNIDTGNTKYYADSKGSIQNVNSESNSTTVKGTWQSSSDNISVAPKTVETTTNIKFEPLKFELNGKIDLLGNGMKETAFDFSKLTFEQKNQLSGALHTLIYNSIMEKLKQGYLKDGVNPNLWPTI